jgi:hypothetical protein
MSPTIVIPIGSTAPAPMPWTTRNAIRLPMLQATPQSSDPTTKSVTPTSITGLRPKRSASLP